MYVHVLLDSGSQNKASEISKNINFVLALNKARVLGLNTAHDLRLNKADVLALNKAHVLRLKTKMCPVFTTNTKEGGFLYVGSEHWADLSVETYNLCLVESQTICLVEAQDMCCVEG